MTETKKKTGFLSGNQLKLLALVTMTLDHIGVALLPSCTVLRLVGRLAFPIFAWMIAEGCAYTRNRKRYLLQMAVLALVCQSAYFFAMGSLYMCVLVTFTLSIGLIYLLDYAKQVPSPLRLAIPLLGFLAVWFLSELLPELLSGTDFRIDYRLPGILLPVLIYLGRTKWEKLILATAGLVWLALSFPGYQQWFGLLALIPLALYNGNRGKWKLKYLFYIYYPAHLLVIQLIDILI